eukprot:CAMPEP_0115222980 /NCGR_PEP_ID=MMETSP0270-20121206/28797_1 /TAXON_ID=71861 /ORGANISM="Scrippsiella trochoidea, Strain CCMP3099" /LENGTH=236 /DNA_ID=CAMNT_0002637193 /DNA_START=102 /DNA_END=809 /DNA_ORIENTATION=+
MSGESQTTFPGLMSWRIRQAVLVISCLVAIGPSAVTAGNHAGRTRHHPSGHGMWQLHPGSRRFQSAGTALVTEDSAATVRQQTAVQENTRPVCLQAFLTSGPWVALKCWQAGGMPQVSEHLALVDSGAYTWSTSERSWMWQWSLRAQDDDSGVWVTALGVTIFCIGVGFCVFSLRDMHRFVMLLANSAVERKQREAREALTDSGADTPGDANLFALGDKTASSDELADDQKGWSAG